MSKLTAVVLAVAVGGLAYLAFDPHAARDVQNWANRQLGRTKLPDAKQISTPNYMPVVPGNGL